jgi:hypothetical protein
VPEDVIQKLSPGKGGFEFSVRTKSKTKTLSKLGGNGGDKNASSGQVSRTESFHILSILEPYNPTKLLIFNVHGTLLNTSLLTQYNPNPNIRVTQKTTSRRFVFRPWMIEFLGRCFKLFKVALWGIKNI